MAARLVIDIQPHRYGWTCAQCTGQERVFILKSQAIQYAQQKCALVAAEIRVRDRRGTVEQRLVLNPRREAVSA